MIDKIKNCIERALRKESGLPEEALAVEGMTGLMVRHLLNNLGRISGNGLEVGCYRGAMTVASKFGNPDLSYTVCDNWSQFDSNLVELIKNTSKFGIPLYVLGEDCFMVNTGIFNSIDFYIYDGDHSEESHKKALTHFKKALAKQFILVVDDYSWPQVPRGTMQGIEESGMKILFSQELGMGVEGDRDGWWNGIFVALIENI